MWDGTPHTIKGWHGSKWMSGDESVSVYTDISAPVRESFAVAYPEDGEGDIDGVTEISASNVLTLGTDAAADTALTKVVTVNLALTNETVSVNLGDGSGADDPITLRGAFNGAPGLFSCTNSTCTVRADKGKFAGFGDSWTFTADPGATVDDLVVDADHLHLGYWMESMEGDDGMEYQFQAFSGGSAAFGTNPETGSNASIQPLTGTAKYAGPAGGMYVRNKLDPDGDVASATSGSFTANANLTANFGQDAKGALSPADMYSISGTVKNFRDGTTSLSGWTVELMKAGFSTFDADATATAAAQHTVHTNMFSGDTTGGGSWNGQFFGPITADDTGTGDVNEAATGYPSGVAGEFDATFTNGQVNGAFGAVKQP